MKTPPGGESEYVATERGVWMPIHLARMTRGLMNGWAMYTLIFPRGTTMPYNYGTVDFYSEAGDVVAPFTEEALREAHPNATEADLTDMFERTETSRDIFKSELWTLLELAGETAASAMSPGP
ncbi:MAG: hypothetical protein R3362_07175 [Rhodothermales bacterium]|nr:hypothetical protein [Rhodothermales bacterium]